MPPVPTPKRIPIQKYLAAISEPNRLAILQSLKKGERCVCEIHPKLDLQQNLASHHLKILKDTGLLTSRKEGAKIIYSRDEEAIKKYQSALTETLI
jgi:ArsR family transcriptional regulator, arsenate/arsenite/antimonite-responsive transcriptional repressor